MASFGFNDTIKVNNAVNASANRTSPGSQTVYTAPSNGYAILFAKLQGSGATAQLLVGGIVLETTNSSQKIENLYVGPGQAVQLLQSASGSTSLDVAGVEFVNTP